MGHSREVSRESGLAVSCWTKPFYLLHPEWPYYSLSPSPPNPPPTSWLWIPCFYVLSAGNVRVYLASWDFFFIFYNLFAGFKKGILILSFFSWLSLPSVFLWKPCEVVWMKNVPHRLLYLNSWSPGGLGRLWNTSEVQLCHWRWTLRV